MELGCVKCQAFAPTAPSQPAPEEHSASLSGSIGVLTDITSFNLVSLILKIKPVVSTVELL